MGSNKIHVSRTNDKIVIKPSTEFVPLQIIKGVKNRIIPTTNTEELSTYRLSICKQCPIFVDIIYRCDKSGFVVHSITGNPVNGCGCRLKEKTRNYNSSCPALKWGAYKNEEEYLSEKEKNF